MMLVSKDSLQIPSVVVTALLNLHSIVFIRDSELHGEQKSSLFIHIKLPRSQSRSCISSCELELVINWFYLAGEGGSVYLKEEQGPTIHQCPKKREED